MGPGGARTRAGIALASGLATILSGCGGSSSGGSSGSSGSAGGGSASAPCGYLTAADFSAIGRTLRGQPIYNHQSAVGVKDCYYDLGSENDLAYLDFFDTAAVGAQNYTNATDPSAGNGTPVAVSGVGDSAYWMASGNTLFAKKGSTVFQLKLNESGKSATQLQADATALATKIAGRI